MAQAFEPARTARTSESAGTCSLVQKDGQDDKNPPKRGFVLSFACARTLTLYGVWGECVHFCRGVRDCVRFVGTACRSGCILMRKGVYGGC